MTNTFSIIRNLSHVLQIAAAAAAVCGSFRRTRRLYLNYSNAILNPEKRRAQSISIKTAKNETDTSRQCCCRRGRRHCRQRRRQTNDKIGIKCAVCITIIISFSVCTSCRRRPLLLSLLLAIHVFVKLFHHIMNALNRSMTFRFYFTYDSENTCTGHRHTLATLRI